MYEQLSFAVVACALLIPGYKVVTAQNLVHTVLWLGVMLAATAVLFVMLQAPFLAAIQIILYTGGLLTLMLFGVMLTQRDEGFTVIPNPTHRHGIAAVLAALTLGLFGWSIAHTEGLPDAPPQTIGASELGQLFFTHYALAFELLALLLLAATLGAIVLARKADAGNQEELMPQVPPRRPLPRPPQIARDPAPQTAHEAVPLQQAGE